MGIVMKLIKGRPENEEGRLDKEIRVYDLLDSLGMEYYRTDHEPATTMEVYTYMQESVFMQQTEDAVLYAYDAGR